MSPGSVRLYIAKILSVCKAVSSQPWADIIDRPSTETVIKDCFLMLNLKINEQVIARLVAFPVRGAPPGLKFPD